MSSSLKVGLISDTHGRFVGGLVHLLNACDIVFHAGDVTDEGVLDEIMGFAHVCAVHGNNDFSMDTPATRLRQVGRLRFAMVHDLGTPDRMTASIAQLVESESPDVVVHGHTHVPSVESRDGVVFVNPGSAGGRGRGCVQSSAARIDLEEDGWTLRFFQLTETECVPMGEVRTFAYPLR